MTAGGLPHSETLGSKPCRRLPEDYRGPTRPSSVLSAKASTMRPEPATPRTGPQQHNCQTTNHHTNRSQNDRPGPNKGPDETIQADGHHTGRHPLASTLQFSNHHRTRHARADHIHAHEAGAKGTPPQRVAVREPNSASMPQPSDRSTPARPRRPADRPDPRARPRPAQGRGFSRSP